MGKRPTRSRDKRADTPPARREGLKPVIIICLLLVLVTAGIYQQTLRHDFINLDDNDYVFDNKHVQAGLTASGFRYAFASFEASNWHPLTWLSLMSDASIAKATGAKLPATIHFTNIVLHIACVLLLFAVLARMTGSIWKSAFVAAIFAVHPLHVESVAWAAERKDVLSTFFWLLTMLAYVWYAAHPKIGRYALVFVLLALGLMAKPMLVTLPIVLLLMDFWPLRRVQVTGKREQGTGNKEQSGSAGALRQGSGQASPSLPHSAFRTPHSAILEKVPLLALSAASSWVTYHVQQAGGAMKSLESYEFGARAANAAVSCATYLWRMVWPEKLSVFYPHPGRHLPSGEVAGAVLLLACVTVLVIAARKRAPYLAVGWLWYLVTLVPVIGLVQVGTQAMADRYTYVPLIGIFIMIAWGVPDLLSARTRQADRISRAKLQQGHKTYALPILGVALILALAPFAYRQVGYWRDTGTLFSHTISIFPKDAAAHVLVADSSEKKGDKDKAIEEYEQAVRWNPQLPDAQINLGKLLGERKEWDRAAEHYSAYLRLRPQDAPARCSLGNVFLQQSRYEDALREFREAARTDPSSAKAHYYAGAALMSLSRQAEAEDCFAKATELKPDYAEAHAGLAFALCFRGDYRGSWREVHLSRRYGLEPNPNLLAVLSQKMPEPPE